MNTIVIIGGGASGMAAAITASNDKNNNVILLERQQRVGKKLLSTGNGRCNLTTIWTLVLAIDQADDWMNEFEKSKACAIARFKFLRFYFYMSMHVMD